MIVALAGIGLAALPDIALPMIGLDIAVVVELIALLVEIVVRLIALILRVLDGHLRLGSRDDAVVVLGVLQIVLGHDPVAGALRIASELRVFFRDLLRRPADLHIRTVALVVARQGIRPLAVVVVVVVIVVAAAIAGPRMRLFCCCGLIQTLLGFNNLWTRGAGAGLRSMLS